MVLKFVNGHNKKGMPLESKPIDGLAVRTSDWGPDELALLYLDLLGYSDTGEPSLRPRPDENVARRPHPRTGLFSGDPVATPLAISARAAAAGALRRR